MYCLILIIVPFFQQEYGINVLLNWIELNWNERKQTANEQKLDLFSKITNWYSGYRISSLMLDVVLSCVLQSVTAWGSKVVQCLLKLPVPPVVDDAIQPTVAAV